MYPGKAYKQSKKDKQNKHSHGMMQPQMMMQQPVGPNDTLRFQASGKALKGMDLLTGKSDPYLEFYAVDGNRYVKAYQTSVCYNTVKPNWNTISIPLMTLCGGDLNRPVLVKCFDYDQGSMPDHIGDMTFYPRDLLGGGKVKFPLQGSPGLMTMMSSKKMKKHSKHGCGLIVFSGAQIIRHDQMMQSGQTHGQMMPQSNMVAQPSTIQQSHMPMYQQPYIMPQSNMIQQHSMTPQQPMMQQQQPVMHQQQPMMHQQQPMMHQQQPMMQQQQPMMHQQQPMMQQQQPMMQQQPMFHQQQPMMQQQQPMMQQQPASYQQQPMMQQQQPSQVPMYGHSQYQGAKAPVYQPPPSQVPSYQDTAPQYHQQQPQVMSQGTPPVYHGATSSSTPSASAPAAAPDSKPAPSAPSLYPVMKK